MLLVFLPRPVAITVCPLSLPQVGGFSPSGASASPGLSGAPAPFPPAHPQHRPGVVRGCWSWRTHIQLRQGARALEGHGRASAAPVLMEREGPPADRCCPRPLQTRDLGGAGVGNHAWARSPDLDSVGSLTPACCHSKWKFSHLGSRKLCLSHKSCCKC